mgnify:FL=1
MNFFPPTIGLDISDSSLKAAALKKSGDGMFDLMAFGKGYLAEGAVVDGEIKSPDGFEKTLAEVLTGEKNNFPKTKYITASLPEEKAFLRILELPIGLKVKELAEALKYEIEANIPMALDEVYYDHEIAGVDVAAGHYDIMVNAIPKRIADSYVDFFQKNGYQLTALEVDAVATKRALFGGAEVARESALALDIGASRTSFIIVSEGVLRFTSSNTVAGNQFSKMLSEHFPLNLKEAEFMKRIVGLDQNHEKGQELLNALLPDLTALKGQIQDYINFFETHPASHTLSESAKKISKVILTGGGAALWGLGDWLSQELRLGVVLGSLGKRLKMNPMSPAKITLEESLPYATAAGLALRNFDELA